MRDALDGTDPTYLDLAGVALLVLHQRPAGGRLMHSNTY
jgi:hypothetical protein